METEVLFPSKVTFIKDQTPELKGKSMMHLICPILYKKEAFVFSSDFLIMFCSISFFGPDVARRAITVT